MATGINLTGKSCPAVIAFVSFFLGIAVCARASEFISCDYQAKTGKMTTEKECLSLPDAREVKDARSDAAISGKVITMAKYDRDGLAYLYSSAGIFCFNKRGLAIRVLSFDNGPDYFEEGLARTQQNGKIGFFNKKLSILIKPQYDFAFPFNKGVSIVCNGCIKKKTGEHTEIVGGEWGAINKRGEIIHPIIFSKQELLLKLK